MHTERRDAGFSEGELELTDIRGVGSVLAHRLEAAGLQSVELVAASDMETLLAVPGIGEATALRLKSDAATLVYERSAQTSQGTGHSRKRHVKRVAKSVRGLRRAIPDLAKSKKHKKHLKKSTDRLRVWVDDLGKNKVRDRFIAEVSKIGAQAKKRTGSKKDARSLRAHADAIERAVRKVG